MDSNFFRTASRLAPRRPAYDIVRRSESGRADAPLGFFESSFDLRHGLDVCETPVAMIPEDVLRELRRQRAT